MQRVLLDGSAGILPIREHGSSFESREDLVAWMAEAMQARVKVAPDGGLAASVAFVSLGPLIGAVGKRRFLIRNPLAAVLGGLDAVVTVGGVPMQLPAIGDEIILHGGSGFPDVQVDHAREIDVSEPPPFTQPGPLSTHVRGNTPGRFRIRPAAARVVDILAGESVGSSRAGLRGPPVAGSALRCEPWGEHGHELCMEGKSWKDSFLSYSSVGARTRMAPRSAWLFVATRFHELRELSPPPVEVTVTADGEVEVSAPSEPSIWPKLREEELCLERALRYYPYRTRGSPYPAYLESCMSGARSHLSFTFYSDLSHSGTASRREDPDGALGTVDITSDPIPALTERFEGGWGVQVNIESFFASITIGDAGVSVGPGGGLTAEDEISGVCAEHFVRVDDPFVPGSSVYLRTFDGSVAAGC